ncbi:hypothetical protein EVAR_22022_1, partial [Eumeta japonica]
MRGTNEQASLQRVTGHRCPWTPATPDESPLRCRPL